ncbi:predicted protein [Plenodomus lingam JN3]|uniref:Predicted protein n=1 Tax=Leptosphaeria maculans (strain JN3 / isolate v23.1.3 / race Av1-4-5-6-7-8) TaxID=985895 RepID=E5A8K7_LEPMJ|nr:predicted protein [Plenodomus lingam JN3]CBX99952.1 predicted protein [Plenodomus lingam JN3]
MEVKLRTNCNSFTFAQISPLLAEQNSHFSNTLYMHRYSTVVQLKLSLVKRLFSLA